MQSAPAGLSLGGDQSKQSPTWLMSIPNPRAVPYSSKRYHVSSGIFGCFRFSGIFGVLTIRFVTVVTPFSVTADTCVYPSAVSSDQVYSMAWPSSETVGSPVAVAVQPFPGVRVYVVPAGSSVTFRLAGRFSGVSPSQIFRIVAFVSSGSGVGVGVVFVGL